MEEIKDEKYSVTYDSATATVAYWDIVRWLQLRRRHI